MVTIRRYDMPTSVFMELSEEKKERVLSAALDEFASNRFDNASTNAIVKNAGISKGSLFKYFENKEDLYFYLIDTVSERMGAQMAGKTGDLPVDVYDRIIAYSSLEINYYLEHPTEGRLLTNFASERDNDIAAKIEERYGDTSKASYEQLMAGTGLDKNKTDILKWVLEGFNKDFLTRGGTAEEYVKELGMYLGMLREGLI